MDKKITITKKQISILTEALELYCRILCGQINEVHLTLLRNTKLFLDDIDKVGEIERKFDDILKMIKELDHYHGILSDKTPQQAKIAYNLFQDLRNFVSLYVEDELEIVVHGRG